MIGGVPPPYRSNPGNRALGVASTAAFLAIAIAGAVPAAAATTTSTASPSADRTSSAASPSSLNLYVAAGFRYQDPNPYACTATAAMDMLNLIALRGTGGTGFRWSATRSSTTRNEILAWERTHDTMPGGNGSDPHGWRNALNYYGWGSGALQAGSRVYDDFSFGTYDGAVKSAVRAMIQTRKPVAILAWAGQHAQMLVGYYGLKGDPFARNARGEYTNAFSVTGFYLVDPLQSQGFVDRAIAYGTFKSTANLKLRFRTYHETDSPFDDQYTDGIRPARNEWLGKFVIVAPIR